MAEYLEVSCPEVGAENVQVKQGKLAGMIKGSSYGSVYKAYLGIPFAAPPVGKLRFKDPEPPACWEGIRYSQDMSKNMSAQLRRNSDSEIIGSEDCLYLNVYVPLSLQKSAPKAVMVWIHGGAFLRGNGNINETRPDYFMNKDVILVSINYRLGVLGFLNLGIKEASGNQGLKDQVAALKWIKENIACFGGDPNNITVFGCGAGAISAHLLTLSSLSKDLFHKVILQSGVALCHLAIRDQQPEAFKLVTILGYESKDLKETLEYLRKCPYDIIVCAEYHVATKHERSIMKVTFGPTIDKESENPFLPVDVNQLVNHDDNDIPMVLGHTAHEYLGYLPDLSQEALNNLHTDLPLHMKNITGDMYAYNLQSYIHMFETTCIEDVQFNRSNLKDIIRCMSEIHYNIPIKSVAYARSVRRKEMKTYLYIFSYCGEEAKLIPRPNQHLDGVSHADELVYLFYMPRYKFNAITPPDIYSRDYHMIHKLTTMWSNFAKSGNPSYENYVWPSSEDSDLKYINIDGSNLSSVTYKT